MSNSGYDRHVGAQPRCWTAIGIVPGTVADAALGSTARHPGSLPFIIALTAVAILTVVLAVISRKH